MILSWTSRAVTHRHPALRPEAKDRAGTGVTLNAGQTIRSRAVALTISEPAIAHAADKVATRIVENTGAGCRLTGDMPDHPELVK